MMDYLISCGLPAVKNHAALLRMPDLTSVACPHRPPDNAQNERPAEAQDELLESPSEERRLLFLDVDGVLHPLQVPT